jgi:hypothetical protein
MEAIMNNKNKNTTPRHFEGLEARLIAALAYVHQNKAKAEPKRYEAARSVLEEFWASTIKLDASLRDRIIAARMANRSGIPAMGITWEMVDFDLDALKRAVDRKLDEQPVLDIKKRKVIPLDIEIAVHAALILHWEKVIPEYKQPAEVLQAAKKWSQSFKAILNRLRQDYGVINNTLKKVGLAARDKVIADPSKDHRQMVLEAVSKEHGDYIFSGLSNDEVLKEMVAMTASGKARGTNESSIVPRREVKTVDATSTETDSQMKTIFVFGSISITEITEELKNDIWSFIKSVKGDKIVVGDAPGLDSLVQEFLAKKGADVVVYHSGSTCRNNAGGFPTVSVKSTGRGREFYTAKDRAMVEEAQIGIAIWDGQSAGSRRNIRDLSSKGKSVKVFNLGKGTATLVEPRESTKGGNSMDSDFISRVVRDAGKKGYAEEDVRNVLESMALPSEEAVKRLRKEGRGDELKVWHRLALGVISRELRDHRMEAQKIVGGWDAKSFVKKTLSLLFGSLTRSECSADEVELPLCGASFLASAGKRMGFSPRTAEWERPIKVDPNCVGRILGLDPEVLVINLNNLVSKSLIAALVPEFALVDGNVTDVKSGRIVVSAPKKAHKGQLVWFNMSLDARARIVALGIKAAGRESSELLPAHNAWLTEKDKSGKVKQVRVLLAKEGTKRWGRLCEQMGIPESKSHEIFMRAGKDIWKSPEGQRLTRHIWVVPDREHDRDGSCYLKPDRGVAEGSYGLARGYARAENGQGVVFKGRVMCHPHEAFFADDHKVPDEADGWCRAGDFKWNKPFGDQPELVKVTFWIVKKEDEENQKNAYGVHGGFLLLDDLEYGRERLERLFVRRAQTVLGGFSNPVKAVLGGALREDDDNLVVEGNLSRLIMGTTVSEEEAAKGLLNKLRGIRDPKTAYCAVVFTDNWNGKPIGVGEALFSQEVYDSMPPRVKEGGFFGISRYPKTSYQSFCKMKAAEGVNGMEGQFVVLHPDLAVYMQGDDDDHVLVTWELYPSFDPSSGEEPIVRAEAHNLSDLPLTAEVAYLKGEFFREHTGPFTNLLYRSVAYAKSKGKESLAKKLMGFIGHQLDLAVQGAKKHVAEPNFLLIEEQVYSELGIKGKNPRSTFLGDLEEDDPFALMITKKGPDLFRAVQSDVLGSVWGDAEMSVHGHVDNDGEICHSFAGFAETEGCEIDSFTLGLQEWQRNLIRECLDPEGELFGCNAQQWHRNVKEYLTYGLFRRALNLSGDETYGEIVTKIGQLEDEELAKLAPQTLALLKIYTALLVVCERRAAKGDGDYAARSKALAAGSSLVLLGLSDQQLAEFGKIASAQ